MAREDAYLNAEEVTNGNNATFEGSAGETNTAVISGAMGTFDATVFVDHYDGTAWKQVTQLTDDSGNTTFTADWHTQFNRIYVTGTGTPADGDRRLRIENGSGSSGWCAVEGDER